MGITLDKVRWGKYKQYEGPYCHGERKFILPKVPSLSDKLIYVITQTEGGTYDAVNLYDSCICSCSLIQLCDRFHLVSRLLGAVASELGVNAIIEPLREALNLSKAMFKQNKNKQWRFFIGEEECSTEQKLQELYLGGSSGRCGDWTDAQRHHAKTWVVGLAKIWDNPKACDVQVKFIASRLFSFVMPETKKILFADDDWNTWKGAIKAAYLSFAANNPKLASDNFLVALRTTDALIWSPEWCIHVLKQLTFGPNITIYPNRYNKIRPVLEVLFNITDLPKTSDDLKAHTTVVISTLEKETGNSELRQVSQRETPTLPSPEAPLTPISEPPERELVFLEEVINPLPLPPRLPGEVRTTQKVPATFTQFLVNLMMKLFTMSK